MMKIYPSLSKSNRVINIMNPMTKAINFGVEMTFSPKSYASSSSEILYILVISVNPAFDSLSQGEFTAEMVEGID